MYLPEAHVVLYVRALIIVIILAQVQINIVEIRQVHRPGALYGSGQLGFIVGGSWNVGLVVISNKNRRNT